MNRLFIVRTPENTGVLGTLTEREIRRRLAVGALPPTCDCLPADATGDLSRQWRPVWVALGLPHPDADATGEENRPAPAPLSPADTDLSFDLGQGLLTIGQVVSALTCMAAVLSPLWFLWVSLYEGLTPEPASVFLVFAGAPFSFVLAAALFVVFGRVKRLPRS